MARDEGDITTREWVSGIAVVVVLVGLVILVVVAIINAQCNCLTSA